MHDGVSKLWLLRAGRGLSVDGFKDELEAIDALIRHALVWSEGDVDARKARIQAVVDEALKHLDEQEAAAEGD